METKEVSLDMFVTRMMEELSGFTHLYKGMIMGCILALRENYGLVCESSDEEIYERFSGAWKYLCSVGM